MSHPQRYMVTAALPYANGPLHIGHLAGAYLAADIYVRYLRRKGENVLFVCGSDEHGAAITIKAKKEGVSPREIIDKYHTQIKNTFERIGLSFNIYHRTSEPIHYETSQHIFLQLLDKGFLDVQESEQYYDEQFGQFLADRYITGTCPRCQNPGAYGDQCEKCGSSLNPTDLVNPVSTLSGATPVLRTTRHWYLPLDRLQPDIEKWLLTKENSWKTNVYGQCQSWIKGGLQPRAMTRDLDWGIPVPSTDLKGNPIEGVEGKVLYVWLDAPIGYISATRQWAADNGKDWEDYWKKEDTRLVHFIGKDNIVFHCITFPSILHATGEYILPYNVPANEFMNLEGDKISTSRNWAVWVHEYLDELPGREDELRYALIANMPEQKDSEFTWDDFQQKVNSELVATLGNFVNRVTVLTQKYFEGRIPDISADSFSAADRAVLENMEQLAIQVGAAIENYRFRDALQGVMELARSGNKYLADHEPWKLIKTDVPAVERIIFVALQITAGIAGLLEPFLPKAAAKLADMLKLDKLPWPSDGNHILLPAGNTIGQPEILFPKVEDETIATQKEKLFRSKAPVGPTYAPMKETINYDDFSKLDLRTGTILAAEKVEKADKLLKLTVDMGFEHRTIVSGIAEYFQPEDIVGKKVSVVANLAPRKLRGIDSQGMILMAEDAEGNLSFVTADTAPGMVIR